MEKEAFDTYKQIYYGSKFLENDCKFYKISCGKITKENENNVIDLIVEKQQKNIKKELKNLKIKYGFLVKTEDFILNITDDYTYFINKDLKIFKLKNDIKYNYKKIYLSVGHILEYNRFYKILNKVVKDKQKIIDWKNFKKISQIIDYDNLMISQYKILENYFDTTKFPNQFRHNIITNFVHNLSLMKLEILLKTGGKFVNPVSQNTFDSERGIYTTLSTGECTTSRFEGQNPALVFSKKLANDFGYIFNFGFDYGRLNKGSYIKGQTFKLKNEEYSAIERGVIKLCNRKKNLRNHEVIFYTDHIKLEDYLEAIVFHDKKDYNLFKNMKGIRFKNKMVLKE